MRLLAPYYSIFSLVLSSCLLVFSVRASTIAPANNGEVVIQATPSLVHEGFTKDMSVNCSFFEPGSDLQSVMSLIVSKSDTVDDVFREIASITSFSRHTVDIKDKTLGAQAVGQLLENGESFLTLQWTYPGNNVEGKYKCEVFGMDSTGHPRTSSSSTAIVRQEVDIDMVLERIKGLDTTQNNVLSRLDQCTRELNDVTSRLDSTKSTLNSLLTYKTTSTSQLNTHSSQLADLIAYKAKTEARLDFSRAAIIISTSSTFRGKRYHLSRKMITDTWLSDSLCRLYGGYLAEINDLQEYNFVYDFVFNQNTFVVERDGESEYVALGATDEDKEGTWVWLRDGRPMTYAHWIKGDPNEGTKENCCYLSGAYGGMISFKCNLSRWTRFLCEIPA